MSDYLKEGHIVHISEPHNSYYRIVATEAFDYETGEEDTAIFSSVASGADSGYKNIKLLEPDNLPMHLYQVRWGVQEIDGVKYYVKIPTGQDRFGVDDDKGIGFINADKSPYYDPNPIFEFYLVDEWYPAINCSNDSPVALTPKVWFQGMKYDIEKITDTNLIRRLDNGEISHRRISFGGIKGSP